MLPSTSSNLFLQNLVVDHEYPRRLLMNSPLDHLKITLPAPSPHNPLDPSSENNLSSNLIMIVMLFLCALICSFCVNFFIRNVIKCLNLNTEEPNLNINTIRDEVTKSGLDKRALKTFPVVKYSKDVKIRGLSNECVICLSEFEKGEKVRILSKCNHGFHVKCIDKWLSLHTSCPTCRQSLINTCQKIIGCDNHQVSSSTTIGAAREAFAINIAPIEREDLVRN